MKAIFKKHQKKINREKPFSTLLEFPRARPFLPAYAFRVVIIHCRASANIKWSPASGCRGFPSYYLFLIPFHIPYPP